MAKVLLVIAPEGYQDKEYNDTKIQLKNKGHKVFTTSTKETAKGKLGETEKVDILMKDVQSNDFDAISFIGGPGSYDYFNNPIAHKLAKDFYNNNKITSAICAAPAILARAGLLKDKVATCYPDVKPILINAGATYTPDPTHKDGKIITASGPDAAKKFGLIIAENL